MMLKGSVAPKERVNIRFVPAAGDGQETIEIPLKTVIVGDFTGRANEEPMESRPAVSVDKSSFVNVMKEMGLQRTLEVKNKLVDDPDATLNVTLDFEGLADFSPDKIARQVPELNKLVALREALTALKGPLGNMPQFRKALDELVGDEEKRKAVLEELGISSSKQQDE